MPKPRLPRGRAARKMEKPYTCRDVLFTCSNGWTIEVVTPEDYNVEGFFMGHCLGLESKPGIGRVKSLREPDGTPHVTINGRVMVGRCNQAPKEQYSKLVQEYMPEAVPQQPTPFQSNYRRPDSETQV